MGRERIIMTDNEAIDILMALAWNRAEEGDVPLCEALEIAMRAIKVVEKMKAHCEGSCIDCPYHNQHMDKCMNDLLKGVEHDGE